MSYYAFNDKMQPVGEHDSVKDAEQALKGKGETGSFTIMKVMRNVEITLREANPVRFRSVSPNVRGPRAKGASAKHRPASK